MARASYQRISNIVLGKPKKSIKKKTKPVKGATFSPSRSTGQYSSPVSVTPKPLRPKLKLKF